MNPFFTALNAFPFSATCDCKMPATRFANSASRPSGAHFSDPKCDGLCARTSLSNVSAVVSGTITGFARLSSYFAMFQLAFILFQPTAEVQAANVVADNVRNLVAAQVVLKHFGVTLMLHNHRFKAHDDATDYVAAH